MSATVAGKINLVKIIYEDGHSEELPDTEDLSQKLHDQYPYGFAIGNESRAWIEKNRSEFGPNVLLEGTFESPDPFSFYAYTQLVLFQTAKDAIRFKLTWK